MRKELLIAVVLFVAVLAGQAMAAEQLLVGTRGGGSEKIWTVDVTTDVATTWNDGTDSGFLSAWGGFALVGDKVWGVQQGSPTGSPRFSVFNLDGTLDGPSILTLPGGDGTGARQLRLGPDNNLYVMATTNPAARIDIRKHDSTTGAYISDLITGLPGNAGSCDFGPDGNVYVSNYDAQQIDKYNGTTGALITSAYITMELAGQPNGAPSDVYFGADANSDSSPDLYASDTYNWLGEFNGRQVEIYDGLTGSFISKLTTRNNPAVNPTRIATDSAGKVWTSIPGSEAVAYWDPPGLVHMNTLQVNGLGDYPLPILILPGAGPAPKNPGDVDEDNFVGGADLTQILTNWGNSGVSWTDGDVDPYNDGITTGDDFIGGGDYTAVLTAWGTSYGPEAVPEPATIGLLLAGLGLLLRKR